MAEFTPIELPGNLIPAEDVELAVLDGNALVLIGAVRSGLRRAGNSPEVLKAFSEEAMSGDYQHVIQTCVAYTTGPVIANG
jgi:hypothetical protein